MPITGRTPREAAQKFCDHVNRVLAKTVTRARVIPLEVRGVPRIQITFRQAGQPTTALLRSRFGPVKFYFGQVCDSVVRPDKLHELRTVTYTYTLTPDRTVKPLLRWEYVREPAPEDRWCRHHFQGPIMLEVNQHKVSLDDMHLPTGYVSFEEVVRFCIVDLKVPMLSRDWDKTLRASYFPVQK